MEGVSYVVMEKVGECIVLDGVAEKEGFVIWKANGRILVSSPPPPPPPPPLYEELDTAHALLLSQFPN